jgi:dynein heavy chain
MLSSKKISTGLFKCPVYKTPDRKGELSTTGHSTNFVMYLDLPIENEDTDKQLRRGTAIILQSVDN